MCFASEKCCWCGEMLLQFAGCTIVVWVQDCYEHCAPQPFFWICLFNLFEGISIKIEGMRTLSLSLILLLLDFSWFHLILSDFTVDRWSGKLSKCLSNNRSSFSAFQSRCFHFFPVYITLLLVLLLVVVVVLQVLLVVQYPGSISSPSTLPLIFSASDAIAKHSLHI